MVNVDDSSVRQRDWEQKAKAKELEDSKRGGKATSRPKRYVDYVAKLSPRLVGLRKLISSFHSMHRNSFKR
jgi:hypothetical protein